MPPEPVVLLRARRAIDAVDAGLVLLLGARRRLARIAADGKRGACLPMRDDARERQVRARAIRMGRRVGLPAGTASALCDVAIADAHRCQGLAPDLGQGGRGGAGAMIPAHMESHASDAAPGASRWLRLLPPPSRLAPLLRAWPPRTQARLLERAMARVLAAPLDAGALDFMRGRRLSIEVPDLRLRWVVTLEGRRLRVVQGVPEAGVRGSATDLLLLAARLEDADTLFFQRRLVLTGDTELGLTARNLLKRLPWDEVPLALRIALNRGARLASAARDAHRAHAAQA
jgi:predicted lipid carrier protein YhbT/chorismate mutase